MKNSVRRFFGFDEDEYMEEDMRDQAEAHEAGITTEYAADQGRPMPEESRETASLSRPSIVKSKVIPMGQRATAAKAKIHFLEPRVYSESEAIADLLLRQEAVLLNFRRMDKEAASRVLDFLQGTIYALSGDIQEVGDGTFLFVPASMEIAGIGKDPYEENFY